MLCGAVSFALSNPARKLTLAYDGAEALAKIAQHSAPPFDVVIIDHKTPVSANHHSLATILNSAEVQAIFDHTNQPTRLSK